MSTAEEKQKERMEIRNAYLTGQKPKRVFVSPAFTWDAALGLAGIDKKKAHYDTALTEQAMEKLCEVFPSDTLIGRISRIAPVYQFLGAKNFIVGSDGTVQHPEINTMEEEDYDEFIKAPYKTIIEKFLPRACTALNKDPVTSGLNLATAYGAYKNQMAAHNAMSGKVGAKFGFVPGFVTNQQIQAPFDFLADQLRGFTRINMDVRRIPAKVKAAVDVITPIMIKMAIPPVMRPGLISFIPLHLGSFLNRKAFEELFWPSMEELIVKLDQMGIACTLFVEEDWTRYCSFLEKLPKSTIMYMERGDPKVFANTVGKNHIFGGFFDPTISLTRTKQECIDEAKRLLDIVMPTGKFYFCFDRSVIDIKSLDVSKIQAVLEWVTENAKY
jgi:hypothetical protein